MELSKVIKEEVCTVSIVGRLDTTTAPELEQFMEETFKEEFKSLKFDLKDLEYVSSAGLRIFLATQKNANKLEREMSLTNVNESVLEVFEITGFTDILTII